MNHLPNLITDLGMILFIAGITTVLFRKLKQPLVLGYILAGFLVNPTFSWFPSVSDVTDIRIWADIGVIFLLFNLGLEFSFKKLLHVGGTAAITSFTEVSAMLVLGFVLGQVMGWSMMDSIFLGGILSISSTTIIIRTFEELQVKSKRFAQLVFAVLIMEDLVAVILLVLLTTIAVSRQFAGQEMLLSILKLAFFLLLWFVAGIFFLPTVLRKVQKHLSDETLLVISVGLCLFMVILATYAGFSPALGAFIMGSILAETTQAERIERIVKPVKDLFGAVFFVSVGMLIDPIVLVNYIGPILLITVIFLFFKTIHVTIGALIGGQPLKIALQAGMSQAQIGEFSFIIATLGVSLKVTSGFLYPIAVAVSAITTFTTPYMIRSSGRVYNWVDQKLPPRMRKSLNRYAAGAQSISQASDWQKVIKAYLTHLVVFSLIILGIIFLFSQYVADWVAGNIANNGTGNLITASACLLMLAPFLWALITRKFQVEAVKALWAHSRFRATLLFLRIVRGVLASVYIGIFLLSFFSLSIAAAGFVLILATGVIFNRQLNAFYVRLEERFFQNYNDRERAEAIKSRHELAPWDAHIAQFQLEMGTPVAGMTLEEMAIRERLGINIAMIRRGEDFFISAPPRYERVYPGDNLFVIGTDEQLEQFKKYVEPMGEPMKTTQYEDVVLRKLIVNRQSFLYKRTIRESGIREMTSGLVVGIERNNRRILNPESHTIMEEEDVLWIVGDKEKIEEVAERHSK